MPSNITLALLDRILDNDNEFTQYIPNSFELKLVALKYPNYQNQLFNKLTQHLDFYLQDPVDLSQITQLRLTKQQKKELFDCVTNNQDRLDRFLNHQLYTGLEQIFCLCSSSDDTSSDDKQYLFEQAKNRPKSFEDEPSLQALVELCPNEEEKEQIFQQGLAHLRETPFKYLRLRDLAKAFTHTKYQSQLLEYLANNIDYVFTAAVTNREIEDLGQAFHHYSHLFCPGDKEFPQEKTRKKIADWYKQRQYEASNMPTILAAISSANRSLPPKVAQRINEFVVIPSQLSSTLWFQQQYQQQFGRFMSIKEALQSESLKEILEQFRTLSHAQATASSAYFSHFFVGLFANMLEQNLVDKAIGQLIDPKNEHQGFNNLLNNFVDVIKAMAQNIDEFSPKYRWTGTLLQQFYEEIKKNDNLKPLKDQLNTLRPDKTEPGADDAITEQQFEQLRTQLLPPSQQPEPTSAARPGMTGTR